MALASDTAMAALIPIDHLPPTLRRVSSTRPLMTGAYKHLTELHRVRSGCLRPGAYLQGSGLGASGRPC